MSAERLAALFEAVRAEGRAAFLPFMTAGLPTPEDSLAIFESLEGADGYEVGIPYSDPLMDGPTIQEAGQRALAAGTTLTSALELVERLVTSTNKPVLVMTYANVVFQVGPARFAERVSASGASGVIVADLPFEESRPVQDAIEDAGLGMALFVAPLTGDDRIARIAGARPAFIYGVAEVGVTGEREVSGGRAIDLSQRVRAITDVPLVMGVGISTPQQAAVVGSHADGVIVGSALVRKVLDAPNVAEAAAAVRSLSAALAASLR
ncbi:MAG: tryptophan synthase subunit alpha [Acidimicrobiia bacterium]|nr:tryptophan synthase subunit alpha [Acidimicrobiia bacterium]